MSYSDGSVELDLPMQQLSELFNVNNFIISQVNPHSFLLSSLALESSNWSDTFWFTRIAVGYVKFMKAQFRCWVKNMLNLVIFSNPTYKAKARRGFTQILTQE